MADTNTPKQRSVTGAKIFVSYSRDDKEFARQISTMLTDMGFEPLMDVRAIHPGEPWQDRLKTLIEQCDKIVFVMTPSYLSSEACEWEVKLASELNKEMIPVLPAELPEGTPVPDVLSKLQYVLFYSDEDDPDSGFYTGIRKLEEFIRTDLGWLRLLRIYRDRATTWQTKHDSEHLLKGALLAEALDWMGQTPKEAHVPPQIAEFIAASEAEYEAEQLRRERRSRRFAAAGVAFTAFALGLAVLAGYFYQESEENLVSLEKARKDNALLARAGERWASGSRNFGEIKVRKTKGEPIDDLAINLDLAREDFRGVIQDLLPESGATEEGSSKGLTQEGRETYRAFIAAIRRDYAEALYYAESGEAAYQMDSVIADMRAEIDKPVIVDAGALKTELSYDYLRRAIYSCHEPDRKVSIADELVAGENFLGEQDLSLTEIQSLAGVSSPGEICDEAFLALCDFVDCTDAGGDTPASDPPVEEPEPEAPGTLDPSPPEPLGPDAEDFVMVVNDTPEEFRIKQIYLHISDGSQLPAAEAFQARLEKDGQFVVLGIEIVDVNYTPSIRYYYNIQADDIEMRLVGKVAEAASGAIDLADATGQKMLQGWTDPALQKLISLDGRYKSLPRNRVEIWL